MDELRTISQRSGEYDPRVNPRPFKSFWMAGFESACHIVRAGHRIDMIAETQHDRLADHDYQAIRELGILVARDTARWHLIERSPRRYDFTPLEPLANAARKHNVQVIWNLCHYGWPDDLDLFSAAFVDRFARYAKAVARYVCDHSDGAPYFSPINEISYFAWAIGTGCVIYPFAQGRDSEVKRQLVRATIAAIDAIREIDCRARFVQPDPMIHVVPPHDRPDLALLAAAHREGQFEAWEMLCGRLEPELGGDPSYLDIVGVNFYHANQWEHCDSSLTAAACQPNPLNWNHDMRDPRWVPFHRLLKECFERYGRPIVLTETSNVGQDRAPWMRDMARELRLALDHGLPVEGACLYPIIDRPDWENLDWWHNSGLFDVHADGDGMLHRRHCAEYVEELKRAQRLIQ